VHEVRITSNLSIAAAPIVVCFGLFIENNLTR